MTELDVYVASLVEQAIGRGAAAPVLRQAVSLTRRLARTALQRRLAAALKAGTAPDSLDALQAFVEPHRLRWKKVARQSQKLGGQPRQRANRQERMFSPEDIAQELGVTPATVTAWCNKGWLRSEGGKVPASVLYAYRTALPRWKRLDALATAAADGAPPPPDESVFAEIAARRQA